MQENPRKITQNTRKHKKNNLKSKKNQEKRPKNKEKRPKINVSSHNIYVLGILSSCPWVMVLQCWTSSISNPLSPRRIVVIVFAPVIPVIPVIPSKMQENLWQINKHTRNTYKNCLNPKKNWEKRPKINVSSHNVYVLGILSSCPWVMVLQCWTSSISHPLSPRRIVIVVVVAPFSVIPISNPQKH